jgi:hypothetical protein
VEALIDHGALLVLDRPVERIEIHVIRREEATRPGMAARQARFGVSDDAVHMAGVVGRRGTRGESAGDGEIGGRVRAIFPDRDADSCAAKAERVNVVGVRN